MTEDPGGTVGCDVCGVMVAADKVSLHNEWHRTEDERLEGLAQTLRELVETVQAVAFERTGLQRLGAGFSHDIDHFVYALSPESH
jgi:hypothetical protein